MGQFRGFQIASGAIASRHLENDIAIRGLFSVESGVSLSGTLSVRSGASFLSSVDVAGAGRFATSVNITGNAIVGGSLTATGASILYSSLGVSGASTLNTVNVTGAFAKVSGALTVEGASSLKSSLDVVGASVLKDTLIVSGAAQFASSVNITGNAILSQSLTVTGASVLKSSLDVAGAAQFATSVNVTGAAQFQNAATVTGNLGVSGASTLNTINVTGAFAKVSGALTVEGASNLKNSLDVVGAAQFASSVNVTGAAQFQNAATVTGALGVSGASTLNSVNITGAGVSTTISGSIKVSGASSELAAAIVTGNLGVSGASSLNSLTATGAAIFGSTVTLAQDPSSALQAATKQYVDHVAQGLTVKEMVWAASKAALPAHSVSKVPAALATDPEVTQLTASGNGKLTLDGYDVANGDRVLIKNQALAKYNGIYVVVDKGDASSPWIIKRAEDANRVSELPRGTYCFVRNGVDQPNTSWVLLSSISALAIDDAGDDLTFGQFSGAGTLVAGINMSVEGNTVKLGFDGSAVDSKLNMPVQLVSGADLTVNTGSDVLFKSDASNFASISIETGAKMRFQRSDLSYAEANGIDLAKLVDGSTISGADALHSHALGQLGIKEPLAKAMSATGADQEIELAANRNYASDHFDLPSGAGASASDIEVYLNGQLLEQGANASSPPEGGMPRFSFDRSTRIVKVWGSQANDHIYVRYFAKSTNV